MPTFMFVCHAVCGGVFSYSAIRVNNFHKDGRILFIAVTLFFAFHVGFIKAYTGHPVMLVLSVSMMSLFWIVYFAAFFSEKLYLAFFLLISPSSGEVEKEYSRGRTYELQGKFAKAIDEYHKYYMENNTDYVPLERIARCYLHLEKSKEALTMLEKIYSIIRDLKEVKGERKTMELARILFLQQEVCRKYNHKEEGVFRKILQKHYGDTKYAQEKDAFLRSYLEVWQDARG